MSREELIELRKQVQKVIEDGRAFPADVLSAQIVLVFEQAQGVPRNEQARRVAGPRRSAITNRYIPRREENEGEWV